MAFKMNKNKPGSLYNKTAGKNSTSFSKIEDSSSMKSMQDYVIRDGKPVAISTREFDKLAREKAESSGLFPQAGYDYETPLDIADVDPSEFEEGKLYSDKTTGQARRASEMQKGDLGTYKIKDDATSTRVKADFVKPSEAVSIMDTHSGQSRPAYPGDYMDRVKLYNPKKAEDIQQMYKYDNTLQGNKNISEDAKKQNEVNKKAALEELRKRKQGTN